MKIIDKYLQDEQYYIDLYDKQTVEMCRRREKRLLEADFPEEIKSKYSEEVQTDQLRKIIHYTFYFLTGERYLDKSKTIQEWMEKDRELDESLENAKEPNAFCLGCNSKMLCTGKDLHWEDDKRILFFFRCQKCNKNRAFFDNRKEYIPTFKCSNCNKKIEPRYSRKKNKITTKYDCYYCGFIKTDILDMDEKPKETEQKIDKDFDFDRERFCLSEEDGEKYRKEKVNVDNMCRMVDEWEQRDKEKDLYDAVAKIKKLNIADLEKKLLSALEKEGFKKLEFSKPDIGRVVVIEFILQDTTSGINENTRRLTLKKTINTALIETNWKLVEDSVMYKLGFLSGRVRGFELEEDLIKLVQSGHKKLNKIK